jgi:hypothetical protein
MLLGITYLLGKGKTITLCSLHSLKLLFKMPTWFHQEAYKLTENSLLLTYLRRQKFFDFISCLSYIFFFLPLTWLCKGLRSGERCGQFTIPAGPCRTRMRKSSETFENKIHIDVMFCNQNDPRNDLQKCVYCTVPPFGVVCIYFVL